MMHITPEVETYFLSFMLTQNVRSNLPDKKADPILWRTTLLEVAKKMQAWGHSPDCLVRLRRAYQEVGTVNEAWFFEQLGEAYLSWLSRQ